MHRRFAGARRIGIGCPAGSVEVAVAEGFRLRLVGLMGLTAAEVEPLLIPECRSVHTFGMRTPIDLVWLEGGEDPVRPLGVVESLPPRRHAQAPGSRGRRRRVAALELAPGYAKRLGFRARATPPNP